MDMATAMRMGRADLISPSYNTSIIANDSYMDSGGGMKESHAMDADTGKMVGPLGLSMLSLMILGVMVFYVGTKGRQS